MSDFFRYTKSGLGFLTHEAGLECVMLKSERTSLWSPFFYDLHSAIHHKTTAFNINPLYSLGYAFNNFAAALFEKAWFIPENSATYILVARKRAAETGRALGN